MRALLVMACAWLVLASGCGRLHDASDREDLIGTLTGTVRSDGDERGRIRLTFGWRNLEGTVVALAPEQELLRPGGEVPYSLSLYHPPRSALIFDSFFGRSAWGTV